MKKIFSLLVMLVMTATAFAQSTSEKLLDDGYAPNGSVVPAKAITVDWATQKLVVNVNLANCSDTPNECIFSVSTNATDIANWDQESGSTLHLFYTKNAKVWTANGWELTPRSSQFSIVMLATTALQTTTSLLATRPTALS